ncbi:MAG: hypothetical protein M2R46_04377 [Verrucomicrobia subdivision 3 bacterium]|nr:hypothetical protein [Limisphaerales bacterium]
MYGGLLELSSTMAYLADMKRSLILGLVLITLFLPTALRAAHFDIPHVSVYGTATTEVVPDLMRWQLSVRTNGKTVNEAAIKHDKAVTKVIGFLHDQEIDEKKIQTSQVQLAEDWDYRLGNRIKKGYYAVTTIAFESGTLEAYRPLWIGLSKLESISVNGISFDTSKRIEIQEMTRMQALKAAKRKAEALANTLDSDLGEPLMIEEEATRNEDIRSALNNVRSRRIMADADESGDSLSLGTIPIRMRVKVVFHLIH